MWRACSLPQDLTTDRVELFRKLAAAVAEDHDSCLVTVRQLSEAVQAWLGTPPRPQTMRCLVLASVAGLNPPMVPAVTLVDAARAAAEAAPGNAGAVATLRLAEDDPDTKGLALLKGSSEAADDGGGTDWLSAAAVMVGTMFGALDAGGAAEPLPACPLRHEELDVTLVVVDAARQGAKPMLLGGQTVPALCLVRTLTPGMARHDARRLHTLGVSDDAAAGRLGCLDAVAAAWLASGRGGQSSASATTGAVSRQDVARVLQAVTDGSLRLARAVTRDRSHGGGAAASERAGAAASAAADAQAEFGDVCVVIPGHAGEALQGSDACVAVAAALERRAAEAEATASQEQRVAALRLRGSMPAGAASRVRSAPAHQRAAALQVIKRAATLRAGAAGMRRAATGIMVALDAAGMAKGLRAGADALAAAVRSGPTADDMHELNDAIEDGLADVSEAADAMIAGADDTDAEADLALLAELFPDEPGAAAPVAASLPAADGAAGLPGVPAALAPLPEPPSVTMPAPDRERPAW